ncbi:MAG: zinc-binding alcohol dehydrogenase [Lachnospiraceae bacterium]|nr:zinc-binding alcohol dehydrogenase [Lachnospiraceae bacterium]
MEAKQIVFTSKNMAELLDNPEKEPNADQVMVQTHFSTISCGTERANITGDANVSVVDGPSISWPRYAGYSSSGIVVKKGENVKEFEIGDRVVVSWGAHKAYNTAETVNVTKIESDKISLEEAALMHIATFPMAAVRKTRLEVGESALIMGLGILGLFAVQFAKAAGATPVVAVDPVKERRDIALSLGADYAFDPMEENFVSKVKEVTKGGANIAIEVTGIGAGLNQTLNCMARYGRVALLGCTRNSDFSVDFYRKVHGPGISLIGAHAFARPKQDSYPGWFTQKDDIKSIMRLCEFGRIDLKKMIFETHSPQECTEVYTRLVNDRTFPPVVQFDWTKQL